MPRAAALPTARGTRASGSTVKRECETCAYWDRDNDTNQGLCRRHAPKPEFRMVPAEAGIAGVNIAWPLTLAGEFCGEYADRGIGEALSRLERENVDSIIDAAQRDANG